jgi:hypothetical protein
VDLAVDLLAQPAHLASFCPVRASVQVAITTQIPDRKTMSETIAAVQTSTLGLHSLEQYEPFVGAAAIERIMSSV